MNLARRIVIPCMVIALVVAIGVGVYWLVAKNGPPPSGSSRYEEYVQAFQVGVAALDSDLLPQAEENLKRCIELQPKEPAAWANLGLLFLRSGQFDESEKCLLQAKELAPNSNKIRKLIAHLRARQGLFDDSSVILKQIIEQEPTDVRSLFQLVQIVDQQSTESADEDQVAWLDRLLSIEPLNSRLLIEKLRLCIKTRDQESVATILARFDQRQSEWQERTATAYRELKRVLQETPADTNPTTLLRFSNTLLAESSHRFDSAKLETPDAFVGQALEDFLWLAPIQRHTAMADLQLAFTQQRLSLKLEEPSRWLLPFWKTKATPVGLLSCSDKALQIDEVRVEFETSKAPQSPLEVICFDADNDLFTDILIATQGGLQFFFSHEAKRFEDVTAATKLEPSVLEGKYNGGYSVDFDLDGDLDVMLYAVDADFVILQNNLDQTFTPVRPVIGSGPVQASTWADFDNDGAIDVALLTTRGELQIFSNQRSGKFIAWQATPPNDKWLAITSFDATNDGGMDLVGLNQDGALIALSDIDKQKAWRRHRLETANPETLELGSLTSARLWESDFDNNGSLDVLLVNPQASRLWLAQPNGQFELIKTKIDGPVYGVAELDGDGRLDLAAINSAGEPSYWKGSGDKSYRWLEISPQASRGKLDGDNRINSFGIGGTIELRSGSFLVTQMIRNPSVHLGLGNNRRADVIRLLWPNGTFQYEFTPSFNETIVATQRLKGSCPFLFAWDGAQFQFVSDFMWSTPLGMFINASDKGGFLQTTDWVKISGKQLKLSGETYELRVNANLWETHYFDHLALKVVDHPADVQLLIDEKYFLEQAEPKLQWVRQPRKVEQVTDHRGQDVTQILSESDSRYLDVGQRGRYQGLVSEHWIEFTLPAQLVDECPWLLARGWIHPTDSSVNFAISQGAHPVPHGLILEMQSVNGNWITINDRLGFPAGKNKTILIPLKPNQPDVDRVNAETCRFRLRTNLEIYWDWIGLTTPVAEVDFHDFRAPLVLAELRTRGIVDMVQANRSSPELPDYARLVACGQYWRDLHGYHTRPGDIRELLQQVDDRYAILSAGDEVIVRFGLPPALPSDWVRDFVWVSDGWVKDGDLNTRYGKTVLPLPQHNMSAYVGDPNSLESDPVYQRFPNDWEEYHTRYIDTSQFDQGLRRFQTYQPKDVDQ